MNKMIVKPQSRYVDLFRPFDFMFDDFFTRPISKSSSGLMDVYEDDKNVYVEVDVPSYDTQDISIQVDGRRLTISGKKEETNEDKRYKIRERISSSFARTFVLEEIIDESNVSAEIKDGVLIVTIPKNVKIEAKKIEIKKK